jgi:hypothetical protein
MNLGHVDNVICKYLVYFVAHEINPYRLGTKRRGIEDGLAPTIQDISSSLFIPTYNPAQITVQSNK